MTREEIRQQVTCAIVVCVRQALDSHWDRATFERASQGMFLDFLHDEVQDPSEIKTWIEEWYKEMAEVPLHELP